MPHVMSYDEILEATKNDAIIYEEIRSTGIVRPLKFDGIDFVGVRHHCYLLLMECSDDCLDYNLHYRCWNGEPSQELMDKTPWKENPYED